MRPLDTSPEAHAIHVAQLRKMTGGQRVQQVIVMTQMIWAQAGSSIRRRHPDYSDEQVRWATDRLRLGDALYRKAFPEQPLLAP